MGSLPTSDAATPRAAAASSAVHRVLSLLQSADLDSKLEAAGEIRRLTKTSQRCRRHLADAVEPLVAMLCSDSAVAHEAALLALLNLAVKDEKNKVNIVKAGALEPIIKFLQSTTSNIQGHATAALLTLSASTANKPVITTSGAIPLLVDILKTGTPQANADAVMALYNLSTYQDNSRAILDSKPVSAILTLLKASKNLSRTSEKCVALIESLVTFPEGRRALTSEEGGVLSVVEVLEDGSPQGREHAAGTLLVMCESDRCTYRPPILKEGAIPGLLELTVQGSLRAQKKAQRVLRLLRESDTVEGIVCDVMCRIDGEEQAGKARRMVAEMVKVSMEQSLRHLEKRALVCTEGQVSLK